ncbi:MAG: transporter [Verrucomicrobiales bacterium]|nr:transporter [Verrucomicrobiales bacterium]
MKKKTSPNILAMCWSLCFLGPIAAAPAADREPGKHWFEPTGDRAWLGNYDPTLISRRTFSEFTYEDHGQNGDFYKVETSFRWAIPVLDDLALGLQMMVPVQWNKTDISEKSGTGDVEFRAGFIGRISPTLRYGIGVNAVTESASDAALSNNAFILRPIAALRWDATERLNLGVNVEYNFTPIEEGFDEVSALELKFPAAYKISDAWSAALTYKPRWNLLSEQERNRLELIATFQWGPHRQYAFAFGGECPLTSEGIDYKLLTSFAWYF